VNHPVLYDGETATVRLAPNPSALRRPRVLEELGLGEAEIEALAREEVVTLRPSK